MATISSLVPVEEYLRTEYKPNAEYIDGVLHPKPMPTYPHSKMEARLTILMDQLSNGFEAVPEQTVWLREGKYLIPDVAVQRLSELQKPYPTKPIYLCVEILSPDDRFSEVVLKCEDYHAWGVRFCWIVDPEEKQCWEYHGGGRPHQATAGGQIHAGEIALSIDDLFAGFE